MAAEKQNGRQAALSSWGDNCHPTGWGRGAAAGHLRTFKDNFESLSRICFLIDRMDTIADRFYRVKLVHMLYTVESVF